MRSENIRVRLTEEEKAHLIRCARLSDKRFKKSHDVNLSEYIRSLLLSNTHYVSEHEIKKLLKDLNYELRKIGVNVNQIAHKFNGNIGSESDLVALKKYLTEVEEQIVRVEKEVKNAWQSQN